MPADIETRDDPSFTILNMPTKSSPWVPQCDRGVGQATAAEVLSSRQLFIWFLINGEETALRCGCSDRKGTWLNLWVRHPTFLKK